MSLACFNTLVGLSKGTYPCFTDSVPDGYATSDSGYHLTDTDYGLSVIDQCSIQGWTLLQAARSQAIAEIQSDLRAALREKYDGGVSPFSGVVGQITSSGTQSTSKTHIGQRLRAVQKKGAKFVLKKIYLGLNTAGTYTVQIRSNDPLMTAIPDISITVTANSFNAHTLSTPIDLPLFSRACSDRYIEYYITIARGAATPLNNKITCCGARPGWMNHFLVSGFDADDNEATNGGFSSMGYGIAFDGYMACEDLDWICEIKELNGYYVIDVVARALQQRGAAIAISALIDTLQVSPCSGYQIENLNSRRTYLNKRSSDNIAWIVQNIPSGATDCFVCKPEKMFHKSSQLV